MQWIRKGNGGIILIGKCFPDSIDWIGSVSQLCVSCAQNCSDKKHRVRSRVHSAFVILTMNIRPWDRGIHPPGRSGSYWTQDPWNVNNNIYYIGNQNDQHKYAHSSCPQLSCPQPVQDRAPPVHPGTPWWTLTALSDALWWRTRRGGASSNGCQTGNCQHTKHTLKHTKFSTSTGTTPLYIYTVLYKHHQTGNHL